MGSADEGLSELFEDLTPADLVSSAQEDEDLFEQELHTSAEHGESSVVAVVSAVEGAGVPSLSCDKCKMTSEALIR